MVTNGSDKKRKQDEEFVTYITEHEDESFAPDGPGDRALDTFKHLVERLQQEPVFQQDGEHYITAKFPDDAYYFPHRFGPVWKKLQKLQQAHKVILTAPEGKEYVRVPTASGTILYDHVSVTIYCWYAYDTRVLARKHFRTLKQIRNMSPHTLLRIPFYVVEGISSIITNDLEELIDFLIAVFMEEK